MFDDDCEGAGMTCKKFLDENPYSFGECVCKNNYFGPFCQFSWLLAFNFKYNFRLN